LVEVQREIVEMARRNAEIEGECRALRYDLIRQSERRRRRSRLWRSLFAAGRVLWQRLAGVSGNDLEPGWYLRRPPVDSRSA
jgi:hypothetical protein